MSFHLPHRGLSQELRDMIYEHALCPPDGLRIQSIYNSFLDDSEDSKFKCIQPVASALLRTNRQVYDATLPLLYGGNVFSLDMACPNALQFLQALPRKYQMLIRKLSLPLLLMLADDMGNRMHAEELSRFIIDNLCLEDVTLYVPDDLHAGTKKNDDLYEWFMWTLHKAFVKAFQEGHFHKIRFAHPEPCAENLSVHAFYNKGVIEEVLLKECRKPLAARNDLYWSSHYRDGTSCRDTLDAVHGFECEVWHRAGYSLERDISRPGEKGTVLVIRRRAAALKRRHEEDGSTRAGKRVEANEERRGESGERGEV